VHPKHVLFEALWLELSEANLTVNLSDLLLADRSVDVELMVV
jgi:hypothetical protein